MAHWEVLWGGFCAHQKKIYDAINLLNMVIFDNDHLNFLRLVAYNNNNNNNNNIY